MGHVQSQQTCTTVAPVARFFFQLWLAYCVTCVCCDWIDFSFWSLVTEARPWKLAAILFTECLKKIILFEAIRTQDLLYWPTASWRRFGRPLFTAIQVQKHKVITVFILTLLYISLALGHKSSRSDRVCSFHLLSLLTFFNLSWTATVISLQKDKRDKKQGSVAYNSLLPT